MKFLLRFINIKALKLSISVCFDVLISECFDLIVIDRISTQASKIQIFDLNWQLFSYLLTVIMSFLYLITFFRVRAHTVVEFHDQEGKTTISSQINYNLSL